MPSAFDVRALASTVRVELDDSLSPSEQESIRAHWADLADGGGRDPDQVIRAGLQARAGVSDGGFVVQANTTEGLAERLASEITMSAIGGLRGEALMLHASAVTLDDGRVIGFVGQSGSGKTTAARALGRAFAYVTDETLAVRADGSVIAYPKPLSIGSRPGVKATEPASTLGLRRAPTDGLRLAALVLLDRRPEIDAPFVESVPIIEAVAALVPQTSHLAALQQPLRTLVQSIVSTGGVRRVVYAEASTLPSLIDEVLRETHHEAPMVTDIAKMSEHDCGCSSDASETRLEPSVPAQSGMFWRSTYVDALMVDDALIVFASGSVVVLSGMGPVLWLAADGLTEQELRDVALEELPAPPSGVDVAAVVSQALDGLVEARILVRD